jgi:hypothetical protein
VVKHGPETPPAVALEPSLFNVAAEAVDESVVTGRSETKTP